MSGSAKKKRPVVDDEPKLTASQVARLMGNAKGNFDPISPDCYQFLMDSTVRLRLNARRLYFWQIWRCIGSKFGGLSPCPRDNRGWLNLVHAHDDLGIPLAHLEEAQVELEAKELSRVGDDGRLYPAARIPHKRRRPYRGEEKENEDDELCTQFISTGLLLYLQTLTEDAREQYEGDLKTIHRWGKRMRAEAIGTVREAERALLDGYQRRIGYTEESLRGAPRKTHGAVQLQLIELPQLSIECEFRTQFGGILDTNGNSGVHNPPTLLQSQTAVSDTLRGSQTACEFVENRAENRTREGKSVAAQGPRSTPFLNENLPGEDLNAAVDGLVTTVEDLTGTQLTDPHLIGKFAAIAQTLKVPVSVVSNFLRTRVALVREHRQLDAELRTPEALYQLLNNELPVWIRQTRLEGGNG
jgi:hypothetical protein